MEYQRKGGKVRKGKDRHENTLLDTPGKRILFLRRNMGMTQEQLTSMLDLEGGVKVGQSYISELERGDTYPSGQLLKALAIVLKTTTDFLVLLTEDPMLPARRDEDVLIVHLDSPESAAEIEELCALVQSTPSDRRKTLISFLRTFTLA